MASFHTCGSRGDVAGKRGNEAAKVGYGRQRRIRAVIRISRRGEYRG